MQMSGHINVHETGAIENTGHKVLAVKTKEGKITATQIKEIYIEHINDDKREHTVQPGMVYISYPTENGLLYTKSELEELHKVCMECELPLYIDGARLGYGLMSPENDMEISDIAKNCDVFYIGGTKIGALFGEAVVITNPKLQKDFRYIMKQKGAMLAKGRLLGIQFDELFTNNLYLKISGHAIRMAMKIKEAMKEKGYLFLYDSYTNQQFPIFPNNVVERLSEKYELCFWKKVDESHTAVRICTSWATKEEDVNQLIKDINSI